MLAAEASERMHAPATANHDIATENVTLCVRMKLTRATPQTVLNNH
jgi:hypothetical protein